MGLPRARLLVLLAALALVAVTVEIARLRSARVRALFVGTVGVLLREREHAAWSGATWLLAAYTLSALLFPRREAVVAMLAAGLGDAAAAIVGRTVSSMRRARPTVIGSKTYAGTIACALVTLGAAWRIAGVSLGAAIVAAVAACIAERWAPRRIARIDDNVRVAIAAGGAAWIVARLTTRFMS